MKYGDFVPRMAQAFPVLISAKRRIGAVVAGVVAGALLSACGGGGGGSSSTPGVTQPAATPTPTTPSSVLVARSSVGWSSPTAFISVNDFLVFGNAAGTGSFDIFITDPFINNALIPTPPSVPDVMNDGFFQGGTAPYPAASGTIIGYLQLAMTPQTITPPAGQYYELGTNYQVTLTDPLAIPDGKYVYCTVYAGSQLIGSGSNAKIENGQDTGPGFVCNTANHGNSVTPAAGFIIPSFPSGQVYTIVYSVGN